MPFYAHPNKPKRFAMDVSYCKSRTTTGTPAITFLLRVFVDVDRDPPQVVTVYRTSKVRKYWRTEDESRI